MKQGNMSLGIEDIFADSGVIAQSFAGFEKREEQIQMAQAVCMAFNSSRHLAVEAGTGVGKSFAYLVPAIETVGNKNCKVLVSTFTITLQQQLINKDLPFLAGCLPNEFAAVLAKGRGNYLCRRRLEYTLQRHRTLFDSNASELEQIYTWAQQSEDGSLSDLPFVPGSKLWDMVNSEHGNCRSRKCPYFSICFYMRARRQLDSADIIVANHALMFSDLVLKAQGVNLLPAYKFIIVDEAHNIEHVAEEHFGITISNYQIKFLLDGLYNPATHKGLLAYTKADKAIDLAATAAQQSMSFFQRVRDWYENNKEQTNGRCYKNFIDDNLSGYLLSLRSELTKLAKQSPDEDDKFEMLRYIQRCDGLLEDLDGFLAQKKDDYVYWVEVNENAKAATRLRSAAINVGDDVKRTLFDRYESVILTSATLSSDCDEEKKGFGFFADRIGLDDFEAVRLGSPFDYENQVTMYIEKDLPEPNSHTFIEAASKALKGYILQTEGRAFVLFTSYSMLQAIADKLNGWLKENNIELLQQGSDLDRGVLLSYFKQDNRSVLFGTSSFWQGVDVPGQALSNVIIVRLPFSVPDQPLIAGRLEKIKQQGGNPFYDYQLPSAVIRFKQGFGRLIRNKTDRGIVVVLDSRIINKRYGQRFLKAIPKCKIQVVGNK